MGLVYDLHPTVEPTNGVKGAKKSVQDGSCRLGLGAFRECVIRRPIERLYSTVAARLLGSPAVYLAGMLPGLRRAVINATAPDQAKQSRGGQQDRQADDEQRLFADGRRGQRRQEDGLHRDAADGESCLVGATSVFSDSGVGTSSSERAMTASSSCANRAANAAHARGAGAVPEP